MSFAQFVEDMGDRPVGMTRTVLIETVHTQKKKLSGLLLSVQNKNKVTIIDRN